MARGRVPHISCTSLIGKVIVAPAVWDMVFLNIVLVVYLFIYLLWGGGGRALHALRVGQVSIFASPVLGLWNGRVMPFVGVK